MAHQAFQSKGLNGPGLAWGVEERGYVLYEPMFTEATARRLAELSDAMPDQGWEDHSEVLESEGFSLEDPAVIPSTKLNQN